MVDSFLRLFDVDFVMFFGLFEGLMWGKRGIEVIGSGEGVVGEMVLVLLRY